MRSNRIFASRSRALGLSAALGVLSVAPSGVAQPDEPPVEEPQPEAPEPAEPAPPEPAPPEPAEPAPPPPPREREPRRRGAVRRDEARRQAAERELEAKKAAEAEEAEVRRLAMSVGVDVIAQYVLSLRDDAAGETDWFHEFELPRAHASIRGRWGDASARILLEAVRSTSEGALIGVAGESIVLRLREAWAGYRLFDTLDIRAGMVPTLTIPALEAAWRSRAVERVGPERVGLLSPADLGAHAVVTLPLDLGWIGAGGYNGEGYAAQELNRGKNAEIAADIHPFGWTELGKPFSVFGSYHNGSSGTGLARADRITAALLWNDVLVGGGASMTYALGVQDDDDKNAVILEGFVRGNPIFGLLLAGQVAHYWRDLDAPERDGLLMVTGAAGYRLFNPLEAWIAVDAFVPSDLTDVALPELDSWRFRAVARATFESMEWRP
jgi:hypothetical protein